MIVNILLVDDNAVRVTHIRALIQQLFDEKALIDHVSNAFDCLRKLEHTTYDILILDICLPSRSGEEPKQDGGIQVVEQIIRNLTLKKPQHLFIITEFDALEEKYQEYVKSEGWSISNCKMHNDGWKVSLSRKLIYILQSKVQSLSIHSTYDLAITTALSEIELEAVLALPVKWTQTPFADDDTFYHTAVFERDGKTLRVVAAAAHEMGMPSAAVLASKMIHNFRPKYLAMVGIAAGVKGSFGDILVADAAWDYGAGKIKYVEGRSLFLPAPSSIPISPLMKARLTFSLMQKSVLREIQQRWSKQRTPNELSAFLGPIASGAAVLENRTLVDDIARLNRKVIGVEMEVYGVFSAARLAVAPRPDFFAIKSICDFATLDKNDAYQEYAAFTSAQYLYEFAMDQLLIK